MATSGGIAVTGGRWRAASIDSHLGYDSVAVGREAASMWALGPFVSGYTQVFQPDDTLRPDDAHLSSGSGVHVALGAPLPKAAVRLDRDGDTVFDDEDACPDVPGIRTPDPKTNGCPPPPRAHRPRPRHHLRRRGRTCPGCPRASATDDPQTNGCARHPRRTAIATTGSSTPRTAMAPTSRASGPANPKTNGCPRTDRDHDGVFDDEDACPDIPGVRTEDPNTNGCPPRR